MKAELVLLLPFAGVLFAGPARRDCGETKSFVATNECGITYGGTWVECATGITEMPTFTVPECSATAAAAADANVASEATANVTATPTGPDALVTPAPYLDTTASPTAENTTSTCSPLWICVDMAIDCGNAKIPHGECYDTCTKSAPSTPPCNPAAAPTGMPSYNNTRAMHKLNTNNFNKGPPRENKSFCKGRPWMCAPKGW